MKTKYRIQYNDPKIGVLVDQHDYDGTSLDGACMHAVRAYRALRLPSGLSITVTGGGLRAVRRTRSAPWVRSVLVSDYT